VHAAAESDKAFAEDPFGDVLGQHEGVRVLRRQVLERDLQQRSVAVADREPGHHEAEPQQVLGDLDVLQHLQGAGVHDGRPRRVRALRDPVEHQRLDAAGGQAAGQRQAGRARADDHDVRARGQCGRLGGHVGSGFCWGHGAVCGTAGHGMRHMPTRVAVARAAT
jgi:hypothetical protein